MSSSLVSNQAIEGLLLLEIDLNGCKKLSDRTDRDNCGHNIANVPTSPRTRRLPCSPATSTSPNQTKNQVAVSGGFQLSCLSPPMHPFTATGAATTSTVIPPRCPVLLVIDDLGVRIKNFGLDPSQDLIVFLEYHPAASASSSAPNSGAVHWHPTATAALPTCIDDESMTGCNSPMPQPLAACAIDDNDNEQRHWAELEPSCEKPARIGCWTELSLGTAATQPG
ncbi:hypothetical protein EDB85DRAFT_1900984 [Lactarius pseudohatsudake]|nr:hypothetical protein EDB85DRAFT_1900984 [Lactarius pseudohatsudake]